MDLGDQRKEGRSDEPRSDELRSDEPRSDELRSDEPRGDGLRSDEPLGTFKELGAFFVLKGEGDKTAMARFIAIADKSIRSDAASNVTMLSPDIQQPSSAVMDFLNGVLGIVSQRSNALTVVVETYHVDPTYRDLYYHHYSRHLFESSRFTTRLTLFKHVLSQNAFTAMTEDELSDLAIGSIVLYPIGRGVIGRTILRPEYISEPAGDRIDLRLTKFGITVRGKRIWIDGFTYRHQDGEVMSCAEVSLLNLVCYYSNEYRDYAVTMPSEILALEEPYASERVTPTRGLGFYDMSRIMSGLRFYPRVYDSKDLLSMRYPVGPQLNEGDLINRVMSWYLSSGIPVAAYLESKTVPRLGHSLVCIGLKRRGETSLKMLAKAFSGERPEHEDVGLTRALRLSHRLVERDRGTNRPLKWEPSTENLCGRKTCRIIEAADLDNDYVVMDDAQLPYAVRPLENLNDSFKSAPQALMVPLHSSMMLDAVYAHENVIALIEGQTTGIFNWANEDIEDGDQIVIRMFMCSARGYKRSRVANHPGLEWIYEELALPHFLWVAELYKIDQYLATDESCRAFAEIVLDTTTTGIDNPYSKVLFMRFPKRMFVRFPDGEELYQEINDNVSDDARKIVPYERNLVCVDVLEQV